MTRYIFNITAPDGEPPIEFCSEPDAAVKILEALGNMWEDSEVVAGPVEGPQFQGKVEDPLDASSAYAIFIGELVHVGW